MGTLIATTVQADTLATTAGVEQARLVQVQFIRNTTHSSGTTAIANDTSVPEIDEGDQILVDTITPTHASNILKVDVSVPNVSHGGAVELCIALFQDSITNALQSSAAYLAHATNHVHGGLTLIHIMEAGTTSSISFQVRAGGTSGTMYINGTNTAVHGAAANSTMTISEYRA